MQMQGGDDHLSVSGSPSLFNGHTEDQQSGQMHDNYRILMMTLSSGWCSINKAQSVIMYNN